MARRPPPPVRDRRQRPACCGRLWPPVLDVAEALHTSAPDRRQNRNLDVDAGSYHARPKTTQETCGAAMDGDSLMTGAQVSSSETDVRVKHRLRGLIHWGSSGKESSRCSNRTAIASSRSDTSLSPVSSDSMLRATSRSLLPSWSCVSASWLVSSPSVQLM